MTVYQQSSQVEAWFSTADYSWLLLMTAGVIMVLLQHFTFFPFVLFCFVLFCFVFGLQFLPRDCNIHPSIVSSGEGADKVILTGG